MESTDHGGGIGNKIKNRFGNLKTHCNIIGIKMGNSRDSYEFASSIAAV